MKATPEQILEDCRKAGELTAEQESAIGAFWAKAETLGWRWQGDARKRDDESIVIRLLASGRGNHYLCITKTGEVTFLPVMMGCSGIPVF